MSQNEPTPLPLPYSRYATFKQIAYSAAQNRPANRCDRCGETDVIISHTNTQGHSICIECAEDDDQEF